MRQTQRFSMTPIAACVRKVCLPAAGLFLSLNPGPVFAGPEGGQVTGGQGNISTPNTTTTVINQQSHHLAIDWTSFNVSADELVRFNQPSSKASALNRILDQSPSQIFGTINANGNVLLVNPNGVFFKPGSSVNVNSLTASALNISSDDFMSEDLDFDGVDGTDGHVVNQGVLQAATGGAINLVGKAVKNEGVILASAGRVNMVAGEKVTLDFDGDGLMQFAVDKELMDNAQSLGAAVSNTGEISADGGSVLLKGSAAKDVFSRVVNNEGVIKAGRIENKGGEIRLVGMGAGSSVLNTGTLNVTGTNGDGGTVVLQSSDTTIVSGDSVIDASSTDTDGGKVKILGDKVGVLDNTVVNVSGATGGGEVLIGGDFRGDNPDIQNAKRTLVADDVKITADANTVGDGGKVIVWADEVTGYYGDISAQGGSTGGDGGFAEVSGKDYLDFKGEVNLAGINGETGTLLLDPLNITIEDGGTAAPIVDVLFDSVPTAGTTRLDADYLNNATANLTLQATNDITFDEIVNITASGVTLTAVAGNDIIVNTAITTNNAAIHLEADSNAGVTDNAGAITIGAAGTLTSGGGDITLIGEDFTIEATVNAGSGDISLSEVGGTFTIGTMAVANAKFSQAELNFLTTSGELSLGRATTAGADGMVVTGGDNVMATVDSVSIDGSIVLDADFTGTVSLLATAGITLNNNFTVDAATTTVNINADAAVSGATDGTGAFTVSDTFTFDSGGNTLNITAADIDLNTTGATTSGGGNTTISVTANGAIGRSIGLGATAGDLTVDNTELNNITANRLTLTSGAGFTVNGITAVSTDQIADRTRLNAATDINFATGESVFTNELFADAGGNITASAAVTVNSGRLTLNSTGGDIVFEQNAGVTALTSSNSSVVLNALRAITGNVNVATDISADSVSLDAFTGIGTGANAIETVTSMLAANNANSNDIQIDNTGSLRISATGNAINNDATTGNIDIEVLGAGNDLTINRPVTAGGNVLLTANDDIIFTQTAGATAVTAGARATLTAGTGSTDGLIVGNANAVTDVNAANIELIADTGIGNTNAIEINATHATNGLAATTASGDIQVVDNTGGLSIGTAGATTGVSVTTGAAGDDITIGTTANSITVNSAVTAGGAGSVTLNANRLLTVNQAVSSVTGALNLTGGTGVTFNAGGDLSTTGAGAITVNATANDITVNSAVTAGGAGSVTLNANRLLIVNQAVSSVTGALNLTGGTGVTFNAGGDLSTTGAGAITVNATANDITVNSAVTAGGAGSVTLNANRLLIVNQAVSSVTGALNLTGGTGVTFNAGGDLSTTGAGTITVNANQNNLTMANGTVFSAGGIIDINALFGDVVLGQLITTSASTAAGAEAINIDAGTAVTDINAGANNITTAAGGRTVIESSTGIGTAADGLETSTGSISVISANSGDIHIDAAAALDVIAATTRRAGNIDISTAAGALTIVAGTAANAVSTGDIGVGVGTVTLSATGGDLNVNDGLSTATGKITLNSVTAGTDVVFGIDGDITTTSGEIEVNAADAITMNAGTILNAGDDIIDFNATTGDIVLGQLRTTSTSMTGGSEAVNISTGGAVTDANAGVNNITTGATGRLVIDAVSGVGSADAIETSVAQFDIDTTVSGNIDIDNNFTTADVTLTNINVAAGNGTISFDNLGNRALTITSATTSNGNITITNTGNASADTVTIGGAVSAGGANTVTVSSLIRGDITVNNTITTRSGGTITLNSSDDITIGAFAVDAGAAGTISLNVDTNNNIAAVLDLGGGMLTAGMINLDGGATNVVTFRDTLIAQNQANTWVLTTGDDDGTLANASLSSTANFTDLHHLTGNAMNDRFDFNGGSVSGNIDGRAGINTLDYSSLTAPISVALSAQNLAGFRSTNAGAPRIGGRFDNINSLIGSGGTDTLTGNNDTATWEIDGTNQYQGARFNFSSIENLIGGRGADTFNISADHTGNISGGLGADTFNIRADHTGNISGGLGADRFVFNRDAVVTGRIDGNGGSDSLDFSGYDSTQMLTVTGAGSIDGSQGTVTGGAVDSIVATAPDFDNINSFVGGMLVAPNVDTIWLLTGADSGTFGATGTETVFSDVTMLSGGTSADTFIFRNGTTNTFTNIDGGAAGENNTLIIDSGGDGVPEEFFIDGPNNGRVTTIGGSRFDLTFTNFDNVFGDRDNAVNDTFTIAPGQTWAGTIGGGLGTDTLNISDATATWTVNGLGAGPNIFDSPDTMTTAVDGSSGRVNGTAFVEMEILTGATDVDTFNIQALTNALTINAGGGNDVFNISSNAPTNTGNVNAVIGELTLNGEGNTDTINLGDAGDTTANVGAITGTGITGLGLTGGITYGTVEDININLGTGNDSFTVTSTVATTTLDVDAGGGDDTINVGNANSLDGILSAVSITGGANTAVGDTLNINDQGDADANDYTVTATTVTRSGGTPVVTYGTGTTIENLNLNTGSGVNVVSASGWGTRSGSIVDVGGADTFNLTSGFTTTGDFRIDAIETLSDGTALAGGFVLGANRLIINDALTAVDLSTSVTSLNMTGTNGTTRIDESNAIDLLAITTGVNNFTLVTRDGPVTNSTGAGASIVANDLLLTAGGLGSAIGASGTANDINVTLSGTLTANADSGTGGIYITETNAMSIASIDAGTGDIELESSGTIRDAAGADDAIDITGGGLTIRNSTGIGVDSDDELNLSVESLTVTATGGDAFITEADGLGLGTVNLATNNLDISAIAGNITNDTSALTAGNLLIEARANGGAIGGSGAANDINVTLSGTLTANADSGTGGIYITETNAMSIASIDAGTGDIELESSGTIRDAAGADDVIDITGGGVTIRNSTGIGVDSDDELNLSVESLTVTATGGDAFITEADGLGLGTVNLATNNLDISAIAGNITNDTSALTAGNLLIEARANGGAIGGSGAANDINVTLSGTLTARAESGTGGIYISETTTDMLVGEVNAATGNVELRAIASSIANSGSDITATNLLLEASNAAIGASGTANDINVTLSGTLTARADSGTGGIFITETNAMSVASIDAGTGDIELESSGTIRDAAGADDALDITGGGLTIRNSTGIGVDSDDELNLSVESLTVTATGGDAFITEADGLGLGTVNLATNNLDISAIAGNITNETSALTAGNLLIEARANDAAIGASGTANDINVTLSGTLTARADSGTGGIYITETNAMSIASIDAGTGDIELESSGTIRDAAGADDVIDITGGGVTIRNSTGIGVDSDDELNLSVESLTVTATGGDAFITEADGLGLGTVNLATNNLDISAIAGNITNETSALTAGNLLIEARANGGAIGGSGAANDINVTLSGTLTARAESGTGGIYISETTTDMLVGEVNAATGNVELRAIASSIANSGSDITATNLLLEASNAAIGASGTANDINVTLSGTLTARADSGTGGIYITETNAMSIASIDAGTGDIELESSGTIRDAAGADDVIDITGGGVTIRNSTGIGVDSDDELNLSVESLTVTATGGDAFITEADGLGLGTVNLATNNLDISAIAGNITNDTSALTAGNLLIEARANGGAIGGSGAANDINVTLSGTLTARAESGTGGIYISETTTDMLVGEVNAATGNVELRAIASSIANSGSDITATNLLLEASNAAIGASGTANDINVTLSGTLTARADSGTGGIYITETNAMSIASIDAGTGDIELESSGTIRDAAGADDVIDITGGGVTIRNSTGIGVDSDDELNLSVESLTVTATGGDAFITEADGLGLGTVNLATNNLDISVIAGNITNETSALTAGNLLIEARANGGAIGGSGAANDINVTLSGTLTARAESGTGGIFITETNAMSIASIDAGTGNAGLRTTVGNIMTTSGSGASSITADGLTMNSAGGIGVAGSNVVVTVAGALNLTTAGAGTAGNIYIADTTGINSSQLALFSAAGSAQTVTIDAPGYNIDSNLNTGLDGLDILLLNNGDFNVTADIATGGTSLVFPGLVTAAPGAQIYDTGTGNLTFGRTLSIEGDTTFASTGTITLQSTITDGVAGAGANVVFGGNTILNGTVNTFSSGPAHDGWDVGNLVFNGGTLTINGDHIIETTATGVVNYPTTVINGTVINRTPTGGNNADNTVVRGGVLAIVPAEGESQILGGADNTLGSIPAAPFANFDGHLIIGGSIASISAPTIEATAIDVNARTIGTVSAFETDGAITLLAGDLNLPFGISTDSAGGNTLFLVAAGVDAQVGSTTGTGDILVPNANTTFTAGNVFIAVGNGIADSQNMVLELQEATVEVATGAPNNVTFGPGSSASPGPINGTDGFMSFIELFDSMLNIALITISNPATDLIGTKELGVIDTGLFEKDLTLFGQIGTGIALSLAQCEEIEGCAPNVTPEELDVFIVQIETILEELIGRLDKAGSWAEKEELEKLISGYQDERDNFVKHRADLQDYLTVDEVDEEFEDEFGDDEFSVGLDAEVIKSLANILFRINRRIQALEDLKGDPEAREKLGNSTGIDLSLESLEAIIEAAKSEEKFIEKKMKLLQEGTESGIQPAPLFIAEVGDYSLTQVVNYGPSLSNIGKGKMSDVWY